MSPDVRPLSSAIWPHNILRKSGLYIQPLVVLLNSRCPNATVVDILLILFNVKTTNLADKDSQVQLLI